MFFYSRIKVIFVHVKVYGNYRRNLEAFGNSLSTPNTGAYSEKNNLSISFVIVKNEVLYSLLL